MASSSGAANVTVSFNPSTPNGQTIMRFSGSTMTDADMSLGVQDQADADLECLSAHEFGHALGLDGHSPNRVDLMYPIHYIGTSQPITADDLNTMKTCYASLFGRGYQIPKAAPTGPEHVVIIR